MIHFVRIRIKSQPKDTTKSFRRINLPNNSMVKSISLINKSENVYFFGTSLGNFRNMFFCREITLVNSLEIIATFTSPSFFYYFIF